MSTIFEYKLRQIEHMMDGNLDAETTSNILKLVDGPRLDEEVLEHAKLYSETLPKGHETPFTPQQRYLHFLWDVFDKVPLSLVVPFSIPFRRLIAKRLFKSCGDTFLAEENVRFNFGHLLEVGNNVFFNRGVFLDTKGGIRIGNSVGISEDVRIFTHNHSESSHMEREYHEVVIDDFVKVYAGATILPGVNIGKESIVASGSMVTKDVPPDTVVAGIPAKPIRERKTDGRHEDDLDHIWLF